MENEQEKSGSEGIGWMDQELRDAIASIFKWTGFLAGTSRVLSILLLLSGVALFFNGSEMSAALSETALASIPTSSIAILYILVAILYFTASLYLTRLSRNLKLYHSSGDAGFAVTAILSLKSFFVFVGGMVAAVIGLYLLAILAQLLM
jgi:hypothetical protein